MSITSLFNLRTKSNHHDSLFCSQIFSSRNCTIYINILNSLLADFFGVYIQPHGDISELFLKRILSSSCKTYKIKCIPSISFFYRYFLLEKKLSCLTQLFILMTLLLFYYTCTCVSSLCIYGVELSGKLESQSAILYK